MFYFDEHVMLLELSDPGDGVFNVYGYIQEHHTAELWFKIECAYSNDIIENGTPSDCRCFIDLATIF